MKLINLLLENNPEKIKELQDIAIRFDALMDDLNKLRK
jgi:hypothetical protein